MTQNNGFFLDQKLFILIHFYFDTAICNTFNSVGLKELHW